MTGNLQMVYRGFYDAETGEVTWKTSNSGSEGIQITWASLSPAVVATYGTVTRPEQNTSVTMTATLHSQKLSDFVEDQTVEIVLTVIADGQKGQLDTLMGKHCGKLCRKWC